MILVTGFPRSGTGYTARTLRFAGLDVGHEKVGSDGVVSWWHLLGADKFDKVFHQVRNPIDTISSAMTINNSSIRKLSTITEPNVDKLKFLMQSWLDWNELAESKAQMTYRVEDVEDLFPILRKEMGIKGGFPNVRTTINKREHEVLSVEDLRKVDSELTDKIIERARQYGYKLS